MRCPMIFSAHTSSCTPSSWLLMASLQQEAGQNGICDKQRQTLQLHPVFPSLLCSLMPIHPF